LARRSILDMDTEPAAERLVISDFVRLCIDEGMKPGDAYKEMKKKLNTIKILKNQKLA
jgi:hypothetical protein